MKRKPKHFIPNIITLTNMFLGFIAIGLIIKDQPLNAGIAIMIAGILDVFDGKIARMLGIESKFGMEFDSMADTVSFCVVPSLLVYSLYVDGLQPLLGLFISFMPLMFGTIRLAKYNMDQNSGLKKNHTIRRLVKDEKEIGIQNMTYLKKILTIQINVIKEIEEPQKLLL